MSKLDFRSYYVPYHLKELNSIKEEENESHEEDRLKMDMLKRGKEAKNQLKKKKRWNCYTYYIPHTCVELQKAYGLKQLVDESHPYQASLPYFHVMGSFRLSNELYLS
jgi:hypothetical protein